MYAVLFTATVQLCFVLTEFYNVRMFFCIECSGPWLAEEEGNGAMATPPSVLTLPI